MELIRSPAGRDSIAPYGEIVEVTRQYLKLGCTDLALGRRQFGVGHVTGTTERLAAA